MCNVALGNSQSYMVYIAGEKGGRHGRIGEAMERQGNGGGKGVKIKAPGDDFITTCHSSVPLKYQKSSTARNRDIYKYMYVCIYIYSSRTNSQRSSAQCFSCQA